MMISTKGRYALRVMLDMAEHGGSEWHRLSDVAQRQQLSAGGGGKSVADRVPV